eukprot:1145836-Pelagomonas_calceolata.AAC.25
MLWPLQVEAMLKQWAVGEQDVKDKEKPETSLKLLTVMNEDLDEKDLELVLLQCLKDAPKEEEEDPEKEVGGGGLGEAQGQGGEGPEASPKGCSASALLAGYTTCGLACSGCPSGHAALGLACTFEHSI